MILHTKFTIQDGETLYLAPIKPLEYTMFGFSHSVIGIIGLNSLKYPVIFPNSLTFRKGGRGVRYGSRFFHLTNYIFPIPPFLPPFHARRAPYSSTEFNQSCLNSNSNSDTVSLFNLGDQSQIFLSIQKSQSFQKRVPE